MNKKTEREREREIKDKQKNVRGLFANHIPNKELAGRIYFLVL